MAVAVAVAVAEGNVAVEAVVEKVSSRNKSDSYMHLRRPNFGHAHKMYRRVCLERALSARSIDLV